MSGTEVSDSVIGQAEDFGSNQYTPDLTEVSNKSISIKSDNIAQGCGTSPGRESVLDESQDNIPQGCGTSGGTESVLDESKVFVYNSDTSSWIDIEALQQATLCQSPSLENIMGLDNILDTPIVESCEFHNQVQTSENFEVEHMSYLQDEIEYEKTDPDYGPTISNQKESDVNSDNDPEVLVVTANNTPVRTTRDTTLQSLENIIMLDNIQDMPVEESFEFRHQLPRPEHFEKEHMSDFEDENLENRTDPDYQNESDASSDNDPEAVGVSDNNTLNKTTRTSRGRKRKFEMQTNVTAKKLRNSNKEYYNYKGKLVKQKCFQDFQCPCKAECHNKVGQDVREEEFNKFWALGDYNAQNMFLAASMREKEKARQYTNRPSKRQYSRIYTLRAVPVCREMFRHTFQVSTKKINTALQKIRSDDLKDKRGQKQGGKNKTSDKKLETVKEHINKLPRYKSHYRRDNTDAEFLSPEMTLIKMYDLYVENLIGEERNNEIGEWREGNEKNKNDILKDIDAKDTCNTCDSFAARIQSATGSAKNVLEEAHNKHIDLWREARNLMNHDKLEAHKVKEFEC
ncbi:unnamed protein product [Ceutorhynchus assimilis]|uniref:Uncharacterized protein n=1 Tax=Ceutorhynchus assimilis TaxID=467358 RepID=A0A9N9MNR5_9CUCU|nr:unnamed protein product [Ceutorhynchus assimilis]